MKKLRYFLVLLLMIVLSACNPVNPVPTPSPTPERVENEHMTLTFAFGEREGTYSGEVKNGLPNGTGTFTSQNAEGMDWTYEGAWVSGHMEGEGKSVRSDGTVMEGTYKDDRINGEGRKYWRNRLIYEGYYTNNIADGEGTFYNLHGDVIYSGNFDEGCIDESAADRKARLTPFMKQCVTMTHKEMMDGGDKLEGTKIKITGTITRGFLEYEGWFSFYMSAGDAKNEYVGVGYNLSKGEKAFENGTRVTVWGTFGYIQSKTENGKTYTYPYLEAYSVEAVPAPTASS